MNFRFSKILNESKLKVFERSIAVCLNTIEDI